MERIVLAVGVAVVLVIAATVVHLALTWADRRGWVWYRNADRPAPHTLGLVEEVYHPAIHHVVDEDIREATEADATESGAPPDATEA
jgi:hypothetical protein